MNKEFLTISEFAEKAGVTTQAIYKRLQTDLKEFATVLNGKKVLHIDALELFKDEEKNKQNANELQSIIELLKAQLISKDAQIESLQRALEQQQQLNAATLQTFKALPSSQHNTEEQEKAPKKRHWWSK